MLFYILFTTYLLTLMSSCAYVLLFGGILEKYGAAIMIAGSILTAVAGQHPGWQHPILGIMLIDIAVLAAFVTLALKSDRFWPLWTSGFQLIGVTTHIASALDPAIIPRAYALAQGFWAYPMLITLVLATRATRLAAIADQRRLRVDDRSYHDETQNR